MNLTPMVFEKANELTAEATATIKGAVVLGALMFVLFLLFKREGTSRIIMAAAAAALAVWLVALGGVETVAGWFGQTLES